jgi:NAD(P)-dependent dehydrogenase (short-subunit alcohol dehydrogenase family)
LESRVAIVTGAGRGLGRAYATALARHGAAVLVNDVVGERAEEVTSEIRAGGGTAAMSVDTVVTPSSAQAIATRALSEFGRIDAVVNNAGYLRNGFFEELTATDLDEILDVHVRGAFFVTQAAWAALRASGAGRVVMISSAGGLFALKGVSNYSAAKAAVYGLCRALAWEGADDGIRVNAVMPLAGTEIAVDNPVPSHDAQSGPPRWETLGPRFVVEAVAPLVTYLADSACAVSGEVYSAGFGRFARVFVGEGPGWTARDPSQITVHDVIAHLDEIRTLEPSVVPDGIDHEFEIIADAVQRALR